MCSTDFILFYFSYNHFAPCCYVVDPSQPFRAPTPVSEPSTGVFGCHTAPSTPAFDPLTPVFDYTRFRHPYTRFRHTNTRFRPNTPLIWYAGTGTSITASNGSSAMLIFAFSASRKTNHDISIVNIEKGRDSPLVL
jgi:hypothetical protein